MKKILSSIFVGLLLASCSMPFTKSEPKTPQDGDVVTVHYVGTQDDGTEFDSSRKEGKQPLTFTIGAHNMIAGFEDAVRTMQVGETKRVRIEAKDAYGEEYVQRTITQKEFDEYNKGRIQKVPAGALTGHVEQKFTKEQLKPVFSSFEVGAEKSVKESKLKIIAVQDDKVVVSIDSPSAPFYNKKLSVGMKTDGKNGNTITVTKITGNDVEIDIDQNLQVISKTDKDITVKMRNSHPLAGKALNFEIELLTIKPASENTVEQK